MGRRTEGSVFMPGAYVFPGGALDAGDTCDGLASETRARLACRSQESPERIAGAALRELAEETGLKAKPGAARAMRLIMRAITPPGRSRRFDARILAAKAETVVDLAGDISGDGELSDIGWFTFTETVDLKIAFPTRLALDEIADLLPALKQPAKVPFLYPEDGQNRIEHV